MSDTPKNPAGNEPELNEELKKASNNLWKEIKEFHAFWAPKIFLGLPLFLTIGVLINLYAARIINVYIAGLLFSIAGIIHTFPQLILFVTGLGTFSGAAKEPETIAAEVPEAFKKYARFIAAYLFWYAGIFFVIGIISLKENPHGFAVILVAGLLTALYAYRKEKKVWLADWAIYAFACFMIVVSFLLFIPRHTWIRVTGLDVKGIFGSTPTEEGVSAAEKKAEEERQARNARVLKAITAKIAQGEGRPLEEILSPRELKIYQLLKQERDERTVPGYIGKKARDASDALSVALAPREAQAKPSPPPVVQPVAVQAPPVQVALLPGQAPAPVYAPPPPPPKPPGINLTGKYAWLMSWRYKWEHKQENFVFEFRDGGSEIWVWKFINPVFRALDYPQRIGKLQRTGEKTFEGDLLGGRLSLRFETETFAEGNVWGSPAQLNRGIPYD